MNRLKLLPVIGLFVVACFTLDTFLFRPTRVDEYLRPQDMHADWHVRFIIPDSLIEPVQLTAPDGNHFYGFFVRPVRDTARAFENRVTVLYCHCSGDNINRYWGRVELLWELGYQVFIFDYEGYGRSEGRPTGDAWFADARTALEYCRGRPDVTDSLIVCYGWTLGSFVATYLAADSLPPRGLILEAPLTSTSVLTREGLLLNVPGRFVADADFDNEKRISRVRCPLLITYGDQDTVAVPGRNAERLIEIARSAHVDLTTSKVIGATNVNLPEVMGYDKYGQLVTDFVASCP